MTTQAALTALSQHPSWPDVVKVMEEKRARIEDDILRKVLVEKKVDPADLAYDRGFIAGMRYFVRVPEHAESRLENFLRANGRSSE